MPLLKTTRQEWNAHTKCEMLNSLTNLNCGSDKMFFNFNSNAPVWYKCAILLVIETQSGSRYWTQTWCFFSRKKYVFYMLFVCFHVIQFYPHQWVNNKIYKILCYATQFWKCLQLLSVDLNKQARTRQGLENVTRKNVVNNILRS